MNRNKRAIARQATSRVAIEGPLPDDDDPLLSFVPVPHVAPRKNSITPDRQRAFIAHLAATGIVKQAALHIGASLEALYKLRQRPGAGPFRAAWDMAVDRGVARLEACALARAIEGEERLVVSAGKLVGVERRHNEALSMFFLRQRLPQRYCSDIRPGHPLYERIRAEILAGMKADYERRKAEEARIAQDRKRIRSEEVERLDLEWLAQEEAEARRAADAEAAKTDKERRREEIMEWLGGMELAKLEEVLGLD